MKPGNIAINIVAITTKHLKSGFCQVGFATLEDRSNLRAIALHCGLSFSPVGAPPAARQGLCSLPRSAFAAKAPLPQDFPGSGL
jgi:hypothetical protein